jgi:hypothetical protein
MAFIRGPAPFIDSSQRWTATASSAGRLDLPLDEKLIVDLNLQNAGQEGGYELTRQRFRLARPLQP